MTDIREYDADLFVLVPHELAKRLSHLPDGHRYGSDSEVMLEMGHRARLDPAFTVHRKAYRCSVGGNVFYDACSFVLVMSMGEKQAVMSVPTSAVTPAQVSFLRALHGVELVVDAKLA